VKGFLQTWAVNTIAVLVAAHVVRGIHYDNVSGLLVASLLLGILNAVLRPILVLISLPLLLLTLGLFTFVINAFLLYLVGHLKGFHVDGFWSAFFGGLVISLVSLAVNSLIGNKATSGKRPDQPRPAAPKDQGPVIDV
jgi:putative membrane protein